MLNPNGGNGFILPRGVSGESENSGPGFHWRQRNSPVPRGEKKPNGAGEVCPRGGEAQKGGVENNSPGGGIFFLGVNVLAFLGEILVDTSLCFEQNGMGPPGIWASQRSEVFIRVGPGK